MTFYHIAFVIADSYARAHNKDKYNTTKNIALLSVQEITIQTSKVIETYLILINILLYCYSLLFLSFLLVRHSFPHYIGTEFPNVG